MQLIGQPSNKLKRPLAQSTQLNTPQITYEMAKKKTTIKLPTFSSANKL